MAVTSFTNLPNSAVQSGGRPRGSTITALRDNPLAIQEGDTTAPKIQPAAMRRASFVSGAAAQTQTFTGLGAFRGFEFTVTGTNTGLSQPLNFAYSTDGGSTWSANQTLGSFPPTTGGGIVIGTFDFATGSLKAVMLRSDPAAAAMPTPILTDVTLAGASVSINAIRFQGGAATVTTIAHITVNGGTV